MNDISPLFAVEAEQLLISGLIDEAYELCLSGIEVFPQYVSGYLILAKCLIEKNDIGKAITVTNNAISIFPNNKLIKKMLSDLREVEEVLDKEELIQKSFNPNYSSSGISSGMVIEEKEYEETVQTDVEIPEELPEDIGNLIDETVSDEFKDNIDELILDENNNDYQDIIEIAEATSEEVLPIPSDDSYDNLDLLNLVENNDNIIVDQETDDFEEELLINDFESIPENSIINDNQDNELFGNQGEFLKLILNEDINEYDFEELKSDNLELIPGLEYSPLKLLVSKKEMKIYVQELPDFPEFPNFSQVITKTVSEIIKIDEIIPEIEKFSYIANTLPEDYLQNDPFSQLAMKLEHVKSNAKVEIEDSPFSLDIPKEKTIVSSTLAKIYESQGAFDKAIEAYITLSFREPENSEKYLQEIEQLKQKMDTK